MKKPTLSDCARAVALSVVCVGAAVGLRAARAPETGQEFSGASPRVRLSLNEGWRFTKGDPPGNTVRLDYDERPDEARPSEVRPADAQPLEAERRRTPAAGVLKPWILPTGNAFIRDPARRAAPPPVPWSGDVAYVRGDFDDRSWSTVDLPHDWAIAGPFLETGPSGGMGRLPTAGVGWYRRTIDVPVSDAGRSVFLDVDGAMSYAAVWLNGHLVGGWPFGYASWRVNLTPYVVPGGKNQLAIRLDNPPDSSRWYPGAGLYRSVWLTTTSMVHVAQWGVVVTTRDVSAAAATIDVKVTVDNETPAAKQVRVTTDIYELDKDGLVVGGIVATLPPVAVEVGGTSNATVTGVVTIAKPRRWGPPPTQVPHRYVAVTRVWQGATLVDREETAFGIRDIRFDPDRGVLINGERIPLRGVNNHHDLGALGAAFNLRAAERQLEVLREMGCNAIRMSHNPPAPELLALTDRLGFLIVDEAFDVWERRKTPLDFHLIFPDWHEQDLRAMVRRDRNSPSVILWSIGNEVGEQYTGAEGAALAARLRDIVREEDPTRPVTAAMNYAKADMAMPAVLDVISLNYQGEGIREAPEFEGTDRIRTAPQYEAFRRAFPDKVILSSETASAFSSRGVYLFPVSPERSAPVRDGRGGDSTTRHVSAYELHAVDFGSTADKVFASLARHPFAAGEFVWTGWDHLGEPTPYYDSRSSYAGIIDLAGFRKDRFYLYQSHWRPEYPMAHILPHWTWPERRGQVTPVHVFTSGDEAELFLNGRSLGRKVKGPLEYRLRWDDVRYEPGVLEVVAYRRGARWATDSVKTAGSAAKLDVHVDRPDIRGDGRDLAFVTVTVTDADGVVVPRADHRIRFTIEGPGEIVATDNGDPTSFEPFQAPQRRAFSGLCLAIVRATSGHSGRITVRASSEGLVAGSAVVAVTGGAR